MFSVFVFNFVLINTMEGQNMIQKIHVYVKIVCFVYYTICCWLQVTKAFQETKGCLVFQEKRVNKDLLGLDFQAQLALKVSYFIILTTTLLSKYHGAKYIQGLYMR